MQQTQLLRGNYTNSIHAHSHRLAHNVYATLHAFIQAKSICSRSCHKHSRLFRAQLIGALTIISFSTVAVASLSKRLHFYLPPFLCPLPPSLFDVIYAFWGGAFTQFCSPDRRQQFLFMSRLGLGNRV